MSDVSLIMCGFFLWSFLIFFSLSSKNQNNKNLVIWHQSNVENKAPKTRTCMGWVSMVIQSKELTAIKYPWYLLWIATRTRHRFDVYTTSITLKRRRLDVKTTLYVYWIATSKPTFRYSIGFFRRSKVSHTSSYHGIGLN